MAVEGAVVLTQDRSSGTVHKRVRLAGGSLATLEACNLDAAGAYDVLSRGVGSASQPFRLCERCFPAETLYDVEGVAPV